MNNYHPEIAHLLQQVMDGAISEDQFYRERSRIMAELNDNPVTTIPTASLPVAVERPLSKSEIRAREDAERLKAIKAGRARLPTMIAPTGSKPSNPSQGGKSQGFIGVKPARPVPTVVPLPAAPPDPLAMAEQDVRDQLWRGEINLIEARDAILEVRAMRVSGAARIVCQSRRRCNGGAEMDPAFVGFVDMTRPLGKVMGCKGCEHCVNGEILVPCVGKHCPMCGGRGYLLAKTAPKAPERPEGDTTGDRTLVDHRPEGSYRFCLHGGSHQEETGATSGSAAIGMMLRSLRDSAGFRTALLLPRTVTDKKGDQKGIERIEQPVIVTMRESRQQCRDCRGGGCSVCDGKGTYHKPRVSRLYFDNLEKAGKAILAALKDGHKENVPILCGACKGGLPLKLSCEKCRGRGFVFVPDVHYLDDDLPIKIERKDGDVLSITGSVKVSTQIDRGELAIDLPTTKPEERLRKIGGQQVTTRPSNDAKWAYRKGYAKHHKNGKVTFNNDKHYKGKLNG